MSDSSMTPSDSPATQDDQALGTMMQAVGLLGAGQFGLAAELYRQAAAIFDTQARTADADIRQDVERNRACCQAHAETAEGFDFAKLGDRPKAVASLTEAINQLNRIAQADLGRSICDPGIILSLAGAKTAKYGLEMMVDIADADFDSAIGTAQRILKDIDDSRGQIAGAELPPELAEQLNNMVQTTDLAVHGLERYAAAEKASLDLEWDKARTAFLEAKQLLRDASDTCAAIPMLAAQAQGYQTIVEMMVDPARRRCDRQRKVYEDFEQFKTALAKATGAININVSQIAELTAKIDIRTTIVNEYRDRTRSALDGLRKAIADAPVDDEKRKAVIKDLDGVFAPNVEPDGFLDRLKAFCGKSAEIVGDIAKVAGPVATAWNVFAPLLGWPALPLLAA